MCNHSITRIRLFSPAKLFRLQSRSGSPSWTVPLGDVFIVNLAVRPRVERVDVGTDLKSLIVQLNDDDLEPAAATNPANFKVIAANGDGDRTADFDLRALSLIEDLLAKTEALGLSTGAESSLTAKLNAALHLLGIETAEDQGIVAKLDAFIHGVTLWFDRGDIGLTDRDELIVDAQFIIFGLSLV